MLRQQPREQGRHVLDDHDRNRKIGRQLWNYFPQSIWTPGRSADGNDVDTARDRASARGGVNRDMRRLQNGSAQCQDLGDEFTLYLLARGRKALAAGGLRGIIRRAESQGLQRRGGSVLRQCAEHDDRQLRIELPNLGEGLQPVHAGHFDVERDDVGLELRNLDQRGFPALGRTHQFRACVAAENLSQHRAHNQRVIDDQHADRTWASHVLHLPDSFDLFRLRMLIELHPPGSRGSLVDWRSSTPSHFAGRPPSSTIRPQRLAPKAFRLPGAGFPHAP